MDVRAALAVALERPDLTTAEAILFVERLRSTGYALVPRVFFDRIETLCSEMRNAAEGYRTYKPQPLPRAAGFRDSIPEE